MLLAVIAKVPLTHDMKFHVNVIRLLVGIQMDHAIIVGRAIQSKTLQAGKIALEFSHA
jgi:hypothetical protein